MGKSTSCYTCVFSKVKKDVVYCYEENEGHKISYPTLFNCPNHQNATCYTCKHYTTVHETPYCFFRGITKKKILHPDISGCGDWSEN